MSAPVVSVAMANYNGARFLEPALRSALAQDLGDIEVILVDDASTDDSVERAERMAQQDGRLRIERLDRNSGAGAARNRALELARGQWLAVFDSDDLMHPSRLSRMLERARQDEAAIVCDDLLLFSEENALRTCRFLGRRRARAPSWLTTEGFLLESRIYAGGPDLGYLKPVVRLADWRRAGVRYDESLAIGEDHDLLLRLLAAGLRCRIDPYPLYFYRKHPTSTSHRLTTSAMAGVVAAEARHRADLGPSAPPAVLRAMDRRRDSIRTAEAFTFAIDAFRARRPLTALGHVAARPRAALLFRMPLVAAVGKVLRRLSPKTQPEESFGPKALFVSRQRLVGRTNGSSAYLIDLALAASRAGFEPHLVQPSPTVLGRWPVLWLKPEMRVFRSVRLRGVVRLGPLVFARDPAIYAAAARALLARLLRRLRLARLADTPAPWSPAAPWTDEDCLFVARHAPRDTRVVFADYVWQTESFPFVLDAKARKAVVMHDLFHRRAAAFARQGVSDSVAAMTRAEEARLLARADAIVAIQAEEAETVRRLAPASRVIVAPMTAVPVSCPRPGDSRTLLFVGSNTAPNLIGLQWFFDEVWPLLRKLRPDAELRVVGSVCRALDVAPEGVRRLGVVDRLEPHYAAAGVVVSPLTAGSGLKIKLIEALAQGKACVATSVTLQGVQTETAGAVLQADRPAGFARAVAGLMGDEAARAALGARALQAVRTHFSATGAHAALQAWLRGEPESDAAAEDSLRSEATRLTLPAA